MNEFAMLVPIPDSMPAEEIADHAAAMWLDTVGVSAVGAPTVQVVEYVVVRDPAGKLIYDAALLTDPVTGETWQLPRRTARVCGQVR